VVIRYIGSTLLKGQYCIPLPMRTLQRDLEANGDNTDQDGGPEKRSPSSFW
jgi:hypothetical protein